MPDPRLASIPPWVQVKLQRTAKELEMLRETVERMKEENEELSRRLGALEAEHQRKRSGRARRQKDEAA